jgi:mRNA interferase YafQ
MLELTPTTRFKKDLKRIKHQISAIRDLNEVIDALAKQKSLPEKNLDHSLVGLWKNSRECHVNPDLLLIYRIDLKEGKLFLERLGSHSELF